MYLVSFCSWKFVISKTHFNTQHSISTVTENQLIIQNVSKNQTEPKKKMLGKKQNSGT